MVSVPLYFLNYFRPPSVTSVVRLTKSNFNEFNDVGSFTMG